MPIRQLFARFFVKNVKNVSQWQARVNLFNSAPLSSKDILFLGDSLTSQGLWQEWFPELPIRNRGIEGETTSDLLNRISFKEAKKIFLMIGINDINTGVPENQITGNLKNIIHKINANFPNTKLIVQSILPINHRFYRTGPSNKFIQKINYALMTFVASTNNTFVDLHSCFLDNSGELDIQYTYDGVHLNSNGYELWAKTIFSYIKN